MIRPAPDRRPSQCLRAAVVVVALAAVLAVAACSSSSPRTGEPTETTTATATRTGSAPTTTETSSPTATTPGGSPEPGTAAVPGACTPSVCPMLSAPSESLMTGRVTAANAPQTVPGYIGSVLDDLDDTWGAWFTGLRWGQPQPGRVLVKQGREFLSQCTNADGARELVQADTPNAFFCPLDTATTGAGQRRQGAVVLPVSTFVDIWNGRLLGTSGAFLGEFTAATVIAHEYGHNVVYRIAKSGGVPAADLPHGDNDELIADCLAGNWAATVLKRNQLSIPDIVQAVALLGQIGDARSGEGHGTSPQRIAAISLGFAGPSYNRQGQPIDCLHRYWPEVFA